MIEPHRIRADDAVLDDLRSRLAQTRFPDQIEGTGWEYGIPIDYLRELVEYWRGTYDWRAQETRLNELAHFRPDRRPVDPFHPRALGPRGRASAPSHARLARLGRGVPRRHSPADGTEEHGGRATDAFHVVAPSLPGYGFSEPIRTPGWDVRRVARAFVELMRRLGYTRYGAQGGDWGAQITTRIGAIDPEHCAAIHVNMPIADRPDDPVPLTEEDKAGLATLQRFRRDESGYAQEQSTKPQTLGVGLNDSPAGLLAWIVEKFRTWSDCDGQPENAFTRDQLITNVMTY